MVATPSIVTSDRTATLDATVLQTYQLRVNCVIWPVNCRKQWVGGGDDGDVERDRAADLPTARDPCDPARDPASKISDPRDPLLNSKNITKEFSFFGINTDHRDHVFFT